MFLGFLVLITALAISAVAIYYSVAGLVAIFAAAAVPIIIMGGALEVAKLVTAVWLHRYWQTTVWWLKTYLTTAVFVLMLITSMGIFGFLSRAHIEQTATAQEGMAQIERIDTEIARQESIISRAETRIVKAEESTGNQNSEIQAQIDIEQSRIDSAYTRIQPAIDEQNAIIEAARAADAKRTEPFEQQLSSLDDELNRLVTQAQQYEDRIANLTVDTSIAEPILNQIAAIENSISLVQGQLAGGESAAVQSAQRTIGVEPDGRAGPNTRRAADAWIAQQQSRIEQLQIQVTEAKEQARQSLEAERVRLAGLVEDLRTVQTERVKQRQAELLETIDSVRSTESPSIQAARDEIARLRQNADQVIKQSQELIQRLRDSLTVGEQDSVEETISQETEKIREANLIIDNLVEQKYVLEAEYRKLEAEVGPIKYIAEFVYGESADKDLLEEAVRWVIILIIFVFDPLAVLLLIASQYTIEHHRKQNKKNKETDVQNSSLAVEEKELDTGRIENDIISLLDRTSNNGRDASYKLVVAREGVINDRSMEKDNTNADAAIRDMVSKDNVSSNDVAKQTVEQDQIQFDNLVRQIAESFVDKKEQNLELTSREEEYKIKEQSEDFRDSKTKWKEDHPNETLKVYKAAYIEGKIDKLPWEGYKQNEEQNENSLFNKIRSK